MAACWGLALAGVAGLVNVLVGEQIETNLEGFLLASNVILWVGALSLLFIGIGMFWGESALVPEDSAA